MASCVRNICVKNYQNLIIGFQVTVENVEDVFLGYSVYQVRLNDCGWTFLSQWQARAVVGTISLLLSGIDISGTQFNIGYWEVFWYRKYHSYPIHLIVC